MSDYTVVSGTPGKLVSLHCEQCDKDLLTVPKGCKVKMNNSALMSNAGCFFAQHTVSVRES